MAVQSSPVLPQTPKINSVQFTTTAAAASSLTLYNGGPNGSKITSISATNSSTQSLGTRLNFVSSTPTTFIVNTISTPINAGIDGVTQPSNLMGTSFSALPIDGDGNQYLFLTSSLQSISITITASIQVAGGFLNVTAIGADF